MNRSIKIITITALLAVGLLFLLNGCSKTEKQSAPKSEAEHATHNTQMMGGSGMASQGLAFVNTADTLYHCPMHSEFITNRADAKCAECGMAVKKMSDDDVAQLRASHPKGCAMCDIVVPGDSEMTKCPKCGMDLVDVPAGEHSGHNH